MSYEGWRDISIGLSRSITPLPVLVELQVVSTTSLTSVSLKPSQAGLDPATRKAAFPRSFISSTAEDPFTLPRI